MLNKTVKIFPAPTTAGAVLKAKKDIFLLIEAIYFPPPQSGRNWKQHYDANIVHYQKGLRSFGSILFTCFNLFTTKSTAGK